MTMHFFPTWPCTWFMKLSHCWKVETFFSIKRDISFRVGQIIFPLDYHRWKYNDQSDRNMTKSDGNIKRKDCNSCKCSPLSLFIVGFMFLRSIVRNAVSLFGWSEQIQNKSSPDRVSEGVIAGVKVCYIYISFVMTPKSQVSLCFVE